MLANGCFDPLHYGHLLHLKAARALGDELVIALTSDATVRLEKGTGRPMFDERQRAELLSALRCVDLVLVFDDVIDALRAVRPQVFVKGGDYAGRIQPEHRAYCDARGIEIRIIETPRWSATKVGDALRRR